MLAKQYKILGIPPNADLATIKKAFRLKAMEFHPDHNSSKNAQEKFINIHNAYETILQHKEINKNRIQPTFEEQRQAYINDMYREWLLNEMRKSQERVRIKRMKKEKRELTKREENLQFIGDIFAIAIGTLIFFGTVFGLKQLATRNDIFVSFFTFGISMFMILYPLYFRKKFKD